MPCYNVAIMVSCMNDKNTCNRLTCNYLNVKRMSRGKSNLFSLINVYILNIHNFDNKTLIVIFKEITHVLHFISVHAASFPRNTFFFFLISWNFFESNFPPVNSSRYYWNQLLFVLISLFYSLYSFLMIIHGLGIRNNYFGILNTENIALCNTIIRP